MVLMQVPEYSPPDERGKVPHWYWAKRTCNTLPRGVEKYSNRVFSFTNNVLDWEPYSLENGEVIEKGYQDGAVDPFEWVKHDAMEDYDVSDGEANIIVEICMDFLEIDDLISFVLVFSKSVLLVKILS